MGGVIPVTNSCGRNPDPSRQKHGVETVSNRDTGTHSVSEKTQSLRSRNFTFIIIIKMDDPSNYGPKLFLRRSRKTCHGPCVVYALFTNVLQTLPPNLLSYLPRSSKERNDFYCQDLST